MEACLIFPHQLFEEHPALKMGRPVYLIEEFLFFKQYPFHKTKLVFHRASMKAYAQGLSALGHSVTYIDAFEPIADVGALIKHLSQIDVQVIYLADVVDNWLHKRIQTQAKKLNMRVVVYDSPNFMLGGESVQAYFQSKPKYFQTDFYIQQRKRFNILVDADKPQGGQWSFDAANRLKYPKGRKPPRIEFPQPTVQWSLAMDYVDVNFGQHYGETNGPTYPTTAQASKEWLQKFLETRLANFGLYEDAIVQDEHYLEHSVLTPMLNVGLLTPQYVLSQALDYAAHHEVPLNSIEGFVRQILGWREFIRGVYEWKGTAERNTNHWNFTRKLPESFWTGTTGIAPLDITIKKVLRTGYCHHIERLMVLGNFMLLCEFDPNHVYTWFMTLFIDGYDWVMVPNVYGMSQFADGGLMATKPYISGSNYLMKMSDYPKGEWQQTWDGLFWRFMNTHRNFFMKNPRLGVLIKTFDKMPMSKQQAHLDAANKFLLHLDQSR